MPAPLAPPNPSPLASIAVSSAPATIDPLFARTRTERLVSRQVYEPLIAPLGRPLGLGGTRRGPARLAASEGGGTLWSFQLRGGVRFADGQSLNADAVLANVDRWFDSGAAERILPELVAADSPAPGQVRLQLDQPVPDLPRRLDDPRLGMVSPAAIASRGARQIRSERAGSGPYVLVDRRAAGFALSLDPGWWGSVAGLGPGIERLEFTVAPRGRERLQMLTAGEVEIADGLRTGLAAELAGEPLVAMVRGAGEAVGISSAVRGLSSVGTDQPYSELWLTDLR